MTGHAGPSPGRERRPLGGGRPAVRPSGRDAAPDLLIIGGGVVGLTVALEARRRHEGLAVTVLEKEDQCGAHASGRNSGVVHAGFYYTSDSLKARFTREGNRRLTAYCREKDLPIDRCGKLVVARDEDEAVRLGTLLRRGEANGVPLEMVEPGEAREIEPLARTTGRALYSPSTATVDPGAVMRSLVADARRAGVDVRTGCEYLGRDDRGIVTSRGRMSAGYVVNAAGLYADRVARDFGFSRRYRILPFKGLYLESRREKVPLRTHVYPVPELEYPFLGVHFTLTPGDRLTIGPTATPALWREQYGAWENFDAGELVEILGLEARLFLENAFQFRELAWREMKKYSRARLVRRAAGLVTRDLSTEDWRWGNPGIRAQLLDVEENRLVMDFQWEADGRSLHVLNAISPAFTCAFPLAEHLMDQVDAHAGLAETSQPQEVDHVGTPLD